VTAESVKGVYGPAAARGETVLAYTAVLYRAYGLTEVPHRSRTGIQ
jgi:hypothetical protein